MIWKAPRQRVYRVEDTKEFPVSFAIKEDLMEQNVKQGEGGSHAVR